MYSIDEMIKMLESEDADAIAKKFTDTLNAASKRKTEQENKAVKMKKAEEAAAILNDFMLKYYPDTFKKWHVTGKDLIDILDNTTVFVKEFKSMPSLGSFKSLFDPIDDFLKKNGL